MKKQSCRMTQQERDDHKAAGKYRRMTDRQLMDEIRGLKSEAEKWESKAKAMAALADEAGKPHAKPKETIGLYLDRLLERAGSGNGIGRGTIYKLRKILDSMTEEELKAAGE